MGNMKDSGIEWIGKIPSNWDVKRIKYVTKLYTGNSISDDMKELYEDAENAYPYIATKDLDADNSSVNYENGMYTKKNDYSFRIAPQNSTLMCIEGGSAGKKIAKTNQDVSFVNKLCCFDAKDINADYLYMYLKSEAFREEFNQHISGLIGGVSQNELKGFYILLPSEKEQQLIADFLDDKVGKLDDIISDLRKQVEILQKYKKSVITKAVTKGLNSDVVMKDSGIDWIGEIPESWNYIRLKFCVDTTKGYAFNTDLFTDEGVMVVRASDMKYNTLLQSDVYISNSDSVKYKKVMLKENDIIVSTVGSRPEVVNSAVGQISIVPLEFEGALLNQNTVILKPYDVLNKYMFYYLQCNAFREYMNLYAHGTVNQASLSLIDILNYYFCIPTKLEQQEIADYLDDKCSKIDGLIKDKEAQIEKMEKYKKSLIYEYVTGKKRVKGAV